MDDTSQVLAFRGRAEALEMAGSASAFTTSLAAIGEAAAAGATGDDYKALVCLFLYGGNDYANTLTPYDQPSYAKYQAARTPIAYARDDLAATVLKPSIGLDGGRQYALGPSMASLLPVFDAGHMAPILNIGTLVEPTTKAQFDKGSVRLPPKLFSHNDQQSFWQSSEPEGSGSGWGGRIGDLFQSGNGNAALTCINVGGNAVYLSGRSAVQYSIGQIGPTALLGNDPALNGSRTAGDALRSLMTSPTAHLFAKENERVAKRALDTYDTLASALAAVPAEGYPLLSIVNPFTPQLQIIARMIASAKRLGQKRQVFMIGMGGFDTHDSMPRQHPALVRWVADAMRAFYDTTVAMGVADKVTTFTASDFGRTLTANGDGSDHGWGSHHFVVGGAVKGGRFYGTPNETGSNTDDDVGQGRLLPTTSVDQYAATLATWFGVSDSDRAMVLPNIGNYNASARNLGFV